MEEQSDDSPPRGTVIRGIALGVVVGLGCGAAAVALLYDTPLAAPSSPLAASDCAIESSAMAGDIQPFSVQVDAEGTTLPPELETKIIRGAKVTYAQWRNWLGNDAVRQSQINIRFLGDAQRFREIYGKPNREEWTTTGFYRMRSNQALILYTPAYRGSALSNAFHEISHLIAARHLGATPPWLNEGLAEHYETLQIVGDKARFSANPQHLTLLRQKGPVSVDALTKLSREEWMLEDAERRYASAWALIAFLMDTSSGQQLLGSTIREAYADRCKDRRNFRDTLRRYPGGIEALQSAWHDWLNIRYASIVPRRDIAADRTPTAQ